MKVISAAGISSSIPRTKRQLLHSIDFEVDDGESVAIQGRSGSGKTSLLSILGLMQPADAGELHVGGIDVSRISESRAATLRNELIGFVFQSYSLIGDLTVLENVALPLQYGTPAGGRARAARGMEMLDLVGLSGFARSRPARLSGGEQQRVAIARALVRNPRVVLADEPTGALDSSTRDEIVASLKHAASATGSCLVVVTHDSDVAAQMDRQLHLSDGVLSGESAAK